MPTLAETPKGYINPYAVVVVDQVLGFDAQVAAIGEAKQFSSALPAVFRVDEGEAFRGFCVQGTRKTGHAFMSEHNSGLWHTGGEEARFVDFAAVDNLKLTFAKSHDAGRKQFIGDEF